MSAIAVISILALPSTVLIRLIVSGIGAKSYAL